MSSVPLLSKMQFCMSGSTHLLCTEGEAINLVLMKLKALEYIPDNIQILHLLTTEIDPKNLSIKQFFSIENLQAELLKNLDRAYVGMRFYAVGSERFVWNLKRCVRSFGLSEDEISIEVVDRKSRDIYCSNCLTINSLIKSDIFTCYNCGIKLEVLSHFSRLKNAYLGICADTETL